MCVPSSSFLLPSAVDVTFAGKFCFTDEAANLVSSASYLIRSEQSRDPQAFAAAVGFWVVGVPLSAYLGLYLGWGVKGLWGGMALGEGPLLATYLYVLRYAATST